LNLSDLLGDIEDVLFATMPGPSFQSTIAAIIPTKMPAAIPSALIAMVGTAPALLADTVVAADPVEVVV